MERPEKLLVDMVYRDSNALQRAEGYNDACDEWEKYCNWLVEQHIKIEEELREKARKYDELCK